MHRMLKQYFCILEKSKLRFEALQRNSLQPKGGARALSSWRREPAIEIQRNGEDTYLGLDFHANFLSLSYAHVLLTYTILMCPIFTLDVWTFLIILCISPPCWIIYQALSILSLESYFLLFNTKLYVGLVLH